MSFDKNTTTAEAISEVAKLSACVRSELKHYLSMPSVKEDVTGQLTERIENDLLSLSETERDRIIKQATHRYVVDCDYDCNLSYWENINNLITSELEILQKRKGSR